ncbi:hypothetical protein B9Q04_04895 [Candidatus Marsarchaeota G2 archaeon BE_D]|uniref:Uncharacterized protein n=4 Tax=Candidatus Marsarchaeota group 2 TaxID=2203771 RepID=A0A2R6CCE5_9ARCH|nr:MAG: hypothetical protein B9Q08_00875 [Candidatus Marsarchaeota G2 archaeon ECH_B_SAG-M15]PSN94246.1 MAG: hypothetical protein B9Q06_09755 [Candidatus Marsarchaeota G2 archaeon ECH_B_2]PSO00798.1 MAG: hypothetical protein B9Q05_09950 [Candidatus Marsarchaeota G2 archaeon ECH_B_1]PSO08572.1 MAG: hypothetical protein B9Q04_04895 [Candidatus Marsarchaeota G2 archaeon BE_D]
MECSRFASGAQALVVRKVRNSRLHETVGDPRNGGSSLHRWREQEAFFTVDPKSMPRMRVTLRGNFEFTLKVVVTHTRGLICGGLVTHHFMVSVCTLPGLR